jgi:hypothetical protein
MIACRGPTQPSRLRHNVLSDQLGLNLRNDISHGLIDSVSAGDAVLLLHVACSCVY